MLLGSKSNKWLLLAVLLMLAFVSSNFFMDEYKEEKIVLKTIDGKDIAALYYPVAEPKGLALSLSKGGVVFAHMMPATKESWNKLAKRFAQEGFMSIAIDLRGHGESSGGPQGYQKFTDEEHQKSILDIDAAAKFLFSKGMLPEKLSLIGASIGANLALKYIVDHHDIKTAVLLSAGLNYRGIMTEPLAHALSSGQRVLLVSAEDDGRNAEENKELYASFPETIEHKIQIFPHAGHGTTILENQPELIEEILDFVE